MKIGIIGSGGAGLSCAIELKLAGFSPVVFSKGDLYDGKTASAQGGIQAALGEQDSWQDHFEDTLKAGNNKGKPELVELLTSKAAETIKWLDDLGVEFDRDGDRYQLSNAAGISRPRILSCGDKAGRGIAEALTRRVRELGIETRTNTAVVDLKREHGNFHLTLDEQGKKTEESFNVILIAAGGGLPKEKRAGVVHNGAVSPDSLDLAKSVGAKTVSPDLLQYHPTGIVEPKSLRRKRMPETIRGYGATLKNKAGVEFVDPLLTRNKISDAIVEECEAGNGVATEDGRVGVWLDTPLVDKLNGRGTFEKKFPTFFKLLIDEGHDPNHSPVLVYPVVHYSLGGIEINEKCETNITGLYAAGEATWGVHGDDRLMGNSLLDIFVFGRLAAQSIIDKYKAS